MSEGVDDEPPAPTLEIPAPRGSSIVEQPWELIAQNKKIIKGWELLCQAIPENCLRCYNWLRADPMRKIPGRCYELKHKNYTGAWCYEVGSGQRIYYKPRIESRDVLIYYAGPHP